MPARGLAAFRAWASAAAAAPTLAGPPHRRRSAPPGGGCGARRDSGGVDDDAAVRPRSEPSRDPVWPAAWTGVVAARPSARREARVQGLGYRARLGAVEQPCTDKAAGEVGSVAAWACPP